MKHLYFLLFIASFCLLSLNPVHSAPPVGDPWYCEDSSRQTDWWRAQGGYCATGCTWSIFSGDNPSDVASFQFACKNLQHCYHTDSEGLLDRKGCDALFAADLRFKCNTLKNDPAKYVSCHKHATEYYKQVRNYGGQYYQPEPVNNDGGSNTDPDID